MIRLVLPVPPGVNQWKTPIGHGRTVLSREARAYKEAADRELRAMHMTPIAGPVRLHAVVFRQRPAGDLDGYLKLLQDVLEGFAYENDSQIAELHIIRGPEAPDYPRIVLDVQSIAPLELGVLPDEPGMNTLGAFLRIQKATEAAHAVTLANARVKRAGKKGQPKTLAMLARSASYRRRR